MGRVGNEGLGLGTLSPAMATQKEKKSKRNMWELQGFICERQLGNVCGAGLC